MIRICQTPIIFSGTGSRWRVNSLFSLSLHHYCLELQVGALGGGGSFAFAPPKGRDVQASTLRICNTATVTAERSQLGALGSSTFAFATFKGRGLHTSSLGRCKTITAIAGNRPCPCPSAIVPVSGLNSPRSGPSRSADQEMEQPKGKASS